MIAKGAVVATIYEYNKKEKNCHIFSFYLHKIGILEYPKPIFIDLFIFCHSHQKQHVFTTL